MRNKPQFKKVVRQNYIQVGFVIGAFLLMIIVGGLFVNSILRNRLREETEAILFSAESNIKASLSEVESILLNCEYVLRNMIDSGASQAELKNYLVETTAWMRQREDGLLNFYGIYGFARGEFIDGRGIDPNKNYIPQRRPWYRIAERSINRTAYTHPYVDWTTGDTIISAVRNISNSEGQRYGILSADVDISWIQSYIESLHLTEGGYGIIASQDMMLMTNPHVAHPNMKFIRDNDSDMQLEALSGNYEEISLALKHGESISAKRIIDTDGTEVIVFFREIFNGWYIGLVTPFTRFYSDLFYTMAVLSVLGILLASTLSYILLQLSAAKIQSDEENKSKSSFLARMSHEIRTPMNVIIGISELALREENPPKTNEYISDVRRAGENLLSIINDILDFSKIESGKLDIINAEYALPSLINDCITIINTMLNEKPIELITKIDEHLPSIFLGDESRLRQVLLNLLSNAIKYTKEGQITLTISSSNMPLKDDAILLIFEISDTGIGIKEEDMDKLFGDFNRVDEKSTHGIVGTGLGLAISRNLCRLMGGDITVSSTYGKGSVFTATVQQKVVDSKPFLLLINETGSIGGTERAKVTINFMAPDAHILLVDDLETNLMVAKGLLLPYKTKIDCCGSGNEAIALVRKHNYDIVFMDHMMPGMDGIETTAEIRKWEAEQISGSAKRVTIIALTANAVFGMKQMFLEKGFNDYLSKPIEISKLDEIMKKWIPKEKKSAIKNDKLTTKEDDKNSKTEKLLLDNYSLLINTGVDVKKGIALTGGTEAGYRKILASFFKDAMERLPIFINEINKENLRDWTVNAHAIKSAAATIGASELSKKAAELEAAGKAEDLELIAGNSKTFYTDLKNLVEQIFHSLNEENNTGQKSDTASGCLPLFTELSHFLEQEDIDNIRRIIGELENKALDSSLKEIMDNVSNLVMMSEFEEATEEIKKFLQGEPQ